ncbi:PHP domain-containing protein [Thermococcus sp. 2319x1]|uniref:PHP domain-containing protein n=1 Tax=Thermococcus sp. 2319x1 TaxID=1674923 RepID=UPI0015822173|nr:PHP domain-containing protein [Thermococcus sp. 2319x1]
MDLHTHTRFSDGIGNIRDNIAEAERKGLKIVGISDHAHFFTPHLLNSYLALMDQTKKESEITVMAGIEANILPEGVDINGDFRKKLDYVIASVHLYFDPGRYDEYLELIKLAIQDENIDIIGHFGNVFPYVGYPSIEEYKEIVELAEEYGKAFEISSRYRVPELDFIKLCIQKGVKLAFASDAHRPGDVGNISWSLKAFKKAGGKREDLLFSELL